MARVLGRAGSGDRVWGTVWGRVWGQGLGQAPGWAEGRTVPGFRRPGLRPSAGHVHAEGAGCLAGARSPHSRSG